MNIETLKLKNFRSYKDIDISFGKNTIIIGPNAQGKTNLLEAVYLASVGKSFRGKERDMVLWGEDFFRVEIEAKNSRPQKIEYIYEKNVGKGRKTVKVNGVKRPTSALLEGVRCVFFSPDEIDMFFNFPSLRRRHFNILISQMNKDYTRGLVKYSRILEQRNAQLKAIGEGRAKEEDLEVWDGKIAEQGSKIVCERAEVVTELNKYLSKNYSKIANLENELILNYEPSFSVISTDSAERRAEKSLLLNKEDVWARYLKALISSRRQDIATRVTSVGPHRDNFFFTLGGRPIDTFASRGECRSVILALKLSETKLLNEKTQEVPILLLDDVFSELDETRRKYLAKTFESQQTITTTTDLDHIDKDLCKNAQIYKIENSKLTPLSFRATTRNP